MERRKDSKGRVLRNGESQRNDGRYCYQYIDAAGNRKTVYSWKLNSTDRLPEGKRKCISLREQEKEIQKQIESGVVDSGNITVIELVEKYVLQKQGVREKTKSNYSYVINLLTKDSFGNKKIKRIKPMDVKIWMQRLQQSGKKRNTIKIILGTISPAFQMAVENDLLAKNPFRFQLGKDVLIDDSIVRKPLSPEDEAKLLEYISSTPALRKYLDEIVVLLNTGLRVSEFVGLTLDDLDFKRRVIKVDHQLLPKRGGGQTVCATKTAAGVRTIPMNDAAYSALTNIVNHRKKLENEIEIDGKTGFILLNICGNVKCSNNIQAVLRHIIRRYNKDHDEKLQNITPHTLRHTFCTRCALGGMNPKVLQYIMGHSDISVTLDVYTHADDDAALREMNRFINSGAFGENEFTSEFTSNQC